jgi:hypothetical protein
VAESWKALLDSQIKLPISVTELADRHADMWTEGRKSEEKVTQTVAEIRADVRYHFVEGFLTANKHLAGLVGPTVEETEEWLKSLPWKHSDAEGSAAWVEDNVRAFAEHLRHKAGQRNQGLEKFKKDLKEVGNILKGLLDTLENP